MKRRRRIIINSHSHVFDRWCRDGEFFWSCDCQYYYSDYKHNIILYVLYIGIPNVYYYYYHATGALHPRVDLFKASNGMTERETFCVCWNSIHSNSIRIVSLAERTRRCTLCSVLLFLRTPVPIVCTYVYVWIGHVRKITYRQTTHIGIRIETVFMT